MTKQDINLGAKFLFWFMGLGLVVPILLLVSGMFSIISFLPLLGVVESGSFSGIRSLDMAREPSISAMSGHFTTS